MAHVRPVIVHFVLQVIARVGEHRVIASGRSAWVMITSSTWQDPRRSASALGGVPVAGAWLRHLGIEPRVEDEGALAPTMAHTIAERHDRCVGRDASAAGWS
jgi:hypothetical protein